MGRSSATRRAARPGQCPRAGAAEGQADAARRSERMTHANRLVPLADALRDHSSEGIAILTAEPWRALHALVSTVVALVLAGFAWSFTGGADVIVTGQGTLTPASEVRRFYAPVDGELVNLYVTEGAAVSKGDVLARLNARGAIEAASNATLMQLNL